MIREGRLEDRERIREIQQASPGASQWEPVSFLDYRLLVAEVSGKVGGFLVWRQVCEDEAEILNMAVAPEHRRTGLASDLFRKACEQFTGSWYLEVRESNVAARKLYEKMGFVEIGRIREYYSLPPEGAVVMKLHSC